MTGMNQTLDNTRVIAMATDSLFLFQKMRRGAQTIGRHAATNTGIEITGKLIS